MLWKLLGSTCPSVRMASHQCLYYPWITFYLLFLLVKIHPTPTEHFIRVSSKSAKKLNIWKLTEQLWTYKINRGRVMVANLTQTLCKLVWTTKMPVYVNICTWNCAVTNLKSWNAALVISHPRGITHAYMYSKKILGRDTLKVGNQRMHSALSQQYRFISAYIYRNGL